jgi:adenylate cyclase
VNKKTRLKLSVSLAITFSLAGLILLSVRSKTYQILELKALDVRFNLRKTLPARAPVVHIDIDDTSLAKVGRWPWPRSYHAKLTSILKECGAYQILWDVIFTEPDKENPQEDAIFSEAISKSDSTFFPFYFLEPKSFPYPKLKSLLLKDISISAEAAGKKLGIDAKLIKDKLPQARKMLLDEITRVLVEQKPDISWQQLLEKMEAEYGWFLFAEDEAYVQEQFAVHKLLAFFVNKFAIDIPVRSWPYIKRSGTLNVPIPEYTQRIKGSGFINADPDLDGVTRRVPLFVRYEDKILPQLTIAALIDRLEVKNVEVTREQVTLKYARFHAGLKDIVIPVDEQGTMIVNWHGTWGESFKHVPYYLILQLQETREQLASQGAAPSGAVEFLKKSEKQLMAKLSDMVKEKICIVGLTATGTHDLRPIPLQENYPMVGTHSNIINTILTEKFIVRKVGAVRFAIFFITALVIAIGSLSKLWKSLLVSLGYALGYFGLSLYLFIAYGLWIDLVGPVGIVLFGFAGITSFRFFTEEKEKLWIKQAFSHYLSHEVITELMDDPSRLKLGGERRKITVMFSDIRGFTSFSESRQPEEVVAMLNEVLSLQVKILFQYNGTLDKFVGDEVMAFFGAPSNRHQHDHALVAVRTALDIQAKMKELRQNLAQDKQNAIQIGIGINSGDMVVGNMGSAQRMDYTVIGDNVNLGARLCAAAGHGEIIISEATYDMVADKIAAEKLEPITVKGKAKPISIYRVTGLK